MLKHQHQHHGQGLVYLGAIKSESRVVKVQAIIATHFPLRSWRCLATWRETKVYFTQSRKADAKEAKRTLGRLLTLRQPSLFKSRF